MYIFGGKSKQHAELCVLSQKTNKYNYFYFAYVYMYIKNNLCENMYINR